MFRFLVATAVLAALFPTTAKAQTPGCAGEIDHTIRDPAPLAWTSVGSGADTHWIAELEIGEETLCVNGESITTRVYRVPGEPGTIPGPTITMAPGETYVLQFRNVLPYAPLEEVHNDLKDPNVSNIHTHGLHISGETPSDDVTRSFEGGAGGDFVYAIPPDHMGGTYWYHAHHHGSTFLQVSAGAFGMLLIDDAGDEGVPANVLAMDERHLIIAYLDPAVAGSGGDTLITGTLDPTWTVNGKVRGDLLVPPDTWQHWRILLADRDARLKTLSIGDNCEVALMARDGVWRSEVPRMLVDNAVQLTGASRADLAVRCLGDSEIKVDGTTVANVVIDGNLTGQGHPFAASGELSQATWVPGRPWYLRDLRALTPGNFESINMGARTVNGQKFDVDTPTFVLEAAGVQQWALKGARNHPFHLHVYHVQVQGDCGSYEDGEYYDVIAGNCTLRFDLDASAPEATVYAGRTIMHCHILDHEDEGAMGWLDVIEGAGAVPLPPPSFPAATPAYQAYYPPDAVAPEPPAAPSGLVATAVSTSQIDLSWADNSDDEDGFDIERSDGGAYVTLTSVGANVTTFSDAGLTAGWTYTYRVRSFKYASDPGADDPASEFSNEASATTISDGSPSAMVVESITVSTTSVKGTKYGIAEVVIGDGLGGAVEGATVYGEFSGDVQGPELSSDTDASGLAVLDGVTAFEGKGKPSLVFCVTRVTHETLQDLDSLQECASN